MKPCCRRCLGITKDQDGEDLGEDCVVPFQVAYAVSVHKAQGLEYSSVKLVITKDVEKRITFYTALTRVRERACASIGRPSRRKRFSRVSS